MSHYIKSIEHDLLCQNCHAALQGKFCYKCGQKADTHRLSLVHFVVHEAMHGILHVDKGILYSLKMILTRPGKTARDFIAGKRTGHFNVIALLLLLTATMFFIFNHAYPGDDSFSFGSPERNAFIHANAKWILLSLVPLLSLSSWLIFRKHKFNYAENLLVNSYFMVGFLVLLSLAFAIDWMMPAAGDYTNIASPLLVLFFLGLVYWQTFKNKYSIAGWLWRFVTHFVFFLVISLSSLIALAYLTKGKSKTAEIKIGNTQHH